MTKIDGYHAHVYYDAETRPRAERLREEIAATLGVEVRQLSDEPRGPHPVPQFRFTFTNAQFENIVPWLMLNRQGLDVLVHPLTDNSYDDHSRYAVWLGAPVAGGAEAQHDAPHLPRRAVSDDSCVIVTPAEAGVQGDLRDLASLDSRFR